MEEQVEAPEGAALLFGGAGHFVDILEAGVGVIDGGHKGEVALVGGLHQLVQVTQAVDVFAQRGEFPAVAAVTLFHPAVELEEGDIVGSAFDAGHDAGFVVELDTGRPHVVADACTLDTGGKIIAELVLIGLGEFAPEEGGDVIGLNGLYGGADNGLVEGLKVGLFWKTTSVANSTCMKLQW